MKPFGAFSAKGKWFRGNCHTHTVLSDGKETAAELVDAYRKAGYHFLVLTDHDRCQGEVAPLQRKNFVVINGIELKLPTAAPVGGPHHIVGIGVEKSPDPRLVENGTAASVIRWINRNGGIALYAHPYWSGHDLSNMDEGVSAFAVEIFNAVCEIMLGLGDSSVHADQALSRGFRWRVFAVDDLHSKQRDAFGGWIVVKAKTLDRAAVMTAIRKGHFYASSGPEIKSLSIKRNVARIECSPVRKIVWHRRGSTGGVVGSQGKLITSAEFSTERSRVPGGYLRAEIHDADGRKAWSNPIWWDGKVRRWTD